VLKPSPFTPRAAAKIAEIVASEFPAGVINVVHGDADVGDRKACHQRSEDTGSSLYTRINLISRNFASYRECTSDGGDPEEIKKPLHFFGVALYSAMIR